jgi:hypothetical protein
MGGWVDAHVQAEGLRDSDIETLARFGVEQVVICGHEGGLERPSKASGRDWSAYFDKLLNQQTKRFRRHSVRALFALGISPAAAPLRGLEEALHDLPTFLSHPAVVAIGSLQLRRMDEREESVLRRQLDLAAELRRPVMLTAPATNAARAARKAIGWLRASEVPAERILIEGLSPRAMALATGYGFSAGLEVSPGRLSVVEMADLLRKQGATGLVLTSHAGEGAANLLAVPLATGHLQEAGLSASIVTRVARLNALRFLGRSERASHRPA